MFTNKQQMSVQSQPNNTPVRKCNGPPSTPQPQVGMAGWLPFLFSNPLHFQFTNIVPNTLESIWNLPNCPTAYFSERSNLLANWNHKFGSLLLSNEIVFCIPERVLKTIYVHFPLFFALLSSLALCFLLSFLGGVCCFFRLKVKRSDTIKHTTMSTQHSHHIICSKHFSQSTEYTCTLF